MRRAAKRDENERAIIDALRSVGATVQQLSGEGVPDLLVGCAGVTHLMEVKMPGKGRTPAQVRWHASWLGAMVWVVEAPEDALYALGLRRSPSDMPRETATVANGLLPAPRCECGWPKSAHKPNVRNGAGQALCDEYSPPRATPGRRAKVKR